MNGYGQFQNNGMFNSGRMMQPMSRPQSTLMNNHPKHNAASVNYGNRRSKMDQRQAPPQLNHLTSQASNYPQELEGTCKAQTLPIENVATASNNANQMSSGTPNPNPAQGIIKQIKPPADQYPREIRIDGHDPNQLLPSYYNGGQTTQSMGETHTAGLPVMKNQIPEKNSRGMHNENNENGGKPVAALNETHRVMKKRRIQFQKTGKPSTSLGILKLKLRQRSSRRLKSL